jgi:hypothetical protein
LQQWLAEGRVNGQTQVQAEGSAEWLPLSRALGLGNAPLPPPVPAPRPPGKTSGMAIASLVMGCIGFITCGLTGFIGVILGIIGLRQVKRSGGTLQGEGLAIAGICTSAVSFFMIGLLAALAVPGFVKARKQSQGRRVINDTRQLDAAIDQWALEKGKNNGAAIVTSEVASYLKTDWKDVDLLGNRYIIGKVGPDQIKISPATKEALDGVGVDWGGY